MADLQALWSGEQDLALAVAGQQPVKLPHDLAGAHAFSHEVWSEATRRAPAGWLIDAPAFPDILGGPELGTNERVGRGAAEQTSTDGRRLTRVCHVQHLAPYDDLVQRCLDQVEAAVGGMEGGLVSRDASLFLSPSGGVTPAHLDRHHNLLLDVRGTKTVTVGRFPGHEHLAVAEQRTPHRRLLDRLPDDQQTFHLQPGDALYLPPFVAHWVVNGSEDVNIALSCSWSTRATKDTADLVLLNSRLRQRHLRLGTAGRWPAADRVKLRLARRVAGGRAVA